MCVPVCSRAHYSDAQLFRKVECDDVGMLEHIQEVLKEVLLCSQGNEEGEEQEPAANGEASDQESPDVSSDEMELT